MKEIKLIDFTGLSLPDWITGKPRVTKTKDGIWVGNRFYPNLPKLNAPLNCDVDETKTKDKKKEDK